MQTRKHLWQWIVLATALAALSACDEPESPGAGGKTTRYASGFALWAAPRPVPALAFQNGEGRALGLNDFRGKVVVMNIWATWCGPCREEMPTLDGLQAKLGGADLEVLALSVDQAGPPVVREFFKEIGIKHLKLYIDHSAQAMFALDVIGVPTTLLLDREGRELGRLVGTAKWDGPEMVTFLKSVIDQTQGDKR